MRLPNWDVKLHAWSREVEGKPFVWGETDCATLVIESHRVMYGRDVFGIRPYSTKRQAVHRLKALGGARTALLDAGCAHVDKAFARQGDVILEAEDDGLAALGVVVGRNVLMVTEERVVRVPLRGRPCEVLRYG